jgi:hypothetical protein
MKAWVRSLKIALLCLLWAGAASAAEPWAQPLTQQALSAGFLQRLPPAVSTAFGLAKAQEGSDVRQLLTKDGHRIRTFNVSVANHGDLVVFDIDARGGANVAYLLSADGTLRKAVAYQTFQREARFWSQRAKQLAAKQ